MTDTINESDGFKIDVETISQYAFILLQLGGLFLLKPDFFNKYETGNSFLAGNYATYLMLALSVIFIYLSISFSKKQHAKFWFIAFITGFALFSVVFYKYNKAVDEKTTLLNTERIVKGDQYLPRVQLCANSLKTPDEVVEDAEVIQNCASLQSAAEIDKIWPKAEIRKNINMLLSAYCLSLMLGCLSLISGIQAIKCRKSTV